MDSFLKGCIGFIIGFWGMMILHLCFSFDNDTVTLANEAGKLNISIVCNNGNIYYWNENTKSSYKIDKDTLKMLVENEEKK